MADPLSLLPFAVAAGGGTINALEAQQLVAAGVTLLQRSAMLVRALSGRRSAIMVPPGPEWLLAIAASDGRAVVLLAPDSSAQDIANQLAVANVGAVFTVEALAHKIPAELPVVLLDDMPATATVVAAGRRARVDLGSHHGLTLLGARDVDGSDEACLVTTAAADGGPPALHVISHRTMLRRSRELATALSLTPMDHVLTIGTPGTWPDWPPDWTSALAAPLLRGASLTVRAMSQEDGVGALALVTGAPCSVVVAPAEFWRAIMTERATHQRLQLPATIRQCAVIGPSPSAEVATLFADRTGIPLHSTHATICNRDGR